jgi:hypothetical protein
MDPFQGFQFKWDLNGERVPGGLERQHPPAMEDPHTRERMVLTGGVWEPDLADYGEGG